MALRNDMDDSEIADIVESLKEVLQGDFEIPDLLLERLVSLAFEKQFNADRMILVTDIKDILDNFGYRLD